MRPYLDTSAIASALTIEAATPRVTLWLGANQYREPVISEWVVTECHAALSMKIRRGDLTASKRDNMLPFFRNVVHNDLGTIAVDSLHHDEVARMSDRYRIGFRAGDALHLAICAIEKLALYILDRGQANADRSLGLTTA